MRELFLFGTAIALAGYGIANFDNTEKAGGCLIAAGFIAYLGMIGVL
jgi:hypothetical protein